VVVVPFLHADRLAQKRRPALVSSDRTLARHGPICVEMITSADNAPWPSDTAIDDLKPAGFPEPSEVRPAKIACIEPGRIDRRGEGSTNCGQGCGTEAARNSWMMGFASLNPSHTLNAVGSGRTACGKHSTRFNRSARSRSCPPELRGRALRMFFEIVIVRSIAGASGGDSHVQSAALAAPGGRRGVQRAN